MTLEQVAGKSLGPEALGRLNCDPSLTHSPVIECGETDRWFVVFFEEWMGKSSAGISVTFGTFFLRDLFFLFSPFL